MSVTQLVRIGLIVRFLKNCEQEQQLAKYALGRVVAETPLTQYKHDHDVAVQIIRGVDGARWRTRIGEHLIMPSTPVSVLIDEVWLEVQ